MMFYFFRIEGNTQQQIHAIQKIVYDDYKESIISYDDAFKEPFKYQWIKMKKDMETLYETRFSIARYVWST